MPKLRITVAAVSKIRANLPKEKGKQAFYRDSDLVGFGIRATCLRGTYIVERRIGKDGPNKRIELGDVGLMTLDEARRIARELLSKLVAGIDPTKAEKRNAVPTLREAVSDYLERDLRDSTRKWYKYWSEKWLGDWLELPITEITELMVITRNKGIDLPNPGKPAKNQSNGGKTQMAQVMALLKSVLNYAKNRYKDENGNRLLLSNPVQILVELRENHHIKPRKNSVSASQLPAYFVAVRQLEQIERAFYLFLLYSAFRYSEARLLRWSEVDLVNLAITLPDERVKTGNGRTIPITSQLRLILETLKKDQVDFDCEHVFANTPTSAWPDYKLTRAIDSVRKQTGISDLSNHGLRRTWITHAKNHVDYNDRKLLMGHKVDVTGDYHCTPIDDLRKPAQRAADSLTKLMTGSKDLPPDLFGSVPSLVLLCA
ncbi:MAG: hypothetical protein QG574_3733 [Cyanobacteriota bacterium erpe_2018_sw_21hr_WHONDRS-SW48-000092_B_bin.40]|nr:hypothetical protein [Cyanobacteriota bacterium erpe_2018_sw_21hr_WHONDRS-SW48-000092_B_bin.40]